MAPEKPDYDLYPWVNPVFIENQHSFPPEELLKYRGQHIAWNFAGDRIVASDQDYGELHRKLRDLGIKGRQVIIDYVDNL